MSAIVLVMGRPTKDPAMQKARNSSTEYVSLSISSTQRGQDGKNETTFYECYFNKFLGDRLIKAGVRHRTGIMVYGDLEFSPYIHKQGAKAGQPDVKAKINVKDWHFAPSDRPDNAAGNSAQNGAAAPNYGGAPNPGAGGYPNQGMPSQAAPNQPPMQNGGNYAGAPNVPNAAYSGGYPNGSAGYAGGGYPPQNGAPQNYQASPAGNGYANNGFTNVPESQMGQLPFPT